MTVRLTTTLLGIGMALALPVSGAEVSKTFDFALDQWHQLEAVDGDVTLHRIRLNPREARLSKSTLARPYNSEYLSTVQVQLEYTNGTDENWSSRVSLRWLDAEGRTIDGFSANEALRKKNARKLREFTISTLAYGLERAKTLEVSINFEP